MPLDGFNRRLAIAFGAVLAALGILGACVTANLVEPAKVTPAGWLRQPFSELVELEGVGAATAVLFMGGVGIAGVGLIVAELLPYVRHRYIPAGHGTHREFAVREGAVERMVRYAAAEVDGVRGVEHAHVHRGAHGLEIDCSAILEPDALAGPLAPLLEARLCNAVYSMTGLPVGRVKLRIRHAEYELEPGVV